MDHSSCFQTEIRGWESTSGRRLDPSQRGFWEIPGKWDRLVQVLYIPHKLGMSSWCPLLEPLSRGLIFTRGQFWPSGIVIACVCGSVCVCMCVYQSRACPLDNSSASQARITKFGPEMQNTLVWVPIVFGDDRPWSSRSNLTWKSNFTSFWACSHHYSSAIQARISKFGPKMHLSTVKIPTNFGLDWFWSSLSFWILKPIFFYQIYLRPFCIYLVRLVACKY